MIFRGQIRTPAPPHSTLGCGARGAQQEKLRGTWGSGASKVVPALQPLPATRVQISALCNAALPQKRAGTDPFTGAGAGLRHSQAPQTGPPGFGWPLLSPQGMGGLPTHFKKNIPEF